jgi:hypothetical protein
MIKQIYLAAWLMALSAVAAAQPLDKTSVDTRLGLRPGAVYVVNGAAYAPADSLALNQALAAHPASRLVELRKITDHEKLTVGTTKEVAVIAFAHQQPKPKLRQALRQLRDWFSGQPLAGTEDPPTLIVDNQPIEPSAAKEFIENLKVNNVFYINIQRAAPSTEAKSGNLANGYVRVWTKPM